MHGDILSGRVRDMIAERSVFSDVKFQREWDMGPGVRLYSSGLIFPDLTDT